MEDGCLRGLGHDLNEPNPSYLLVWPDGFEPYREDDTMSVKDRDRRGRSKCGRGSPTIGQNHTGRQRSRPPDRGEYRHEV